MTDEKEKAPPRDCDWCGAKGEGYYLIDDYPDEDGNPMGEPLFNDKGEILALCGECAK